MWEEKVDYFEERKGDFVRRGAVADYQAKWRSSHHVVDSSKFLDQEKNINVPTELKSGQY